MFLTKHLAALKPSPAAFGSPHLRNIPLKSPKEAPEAASTAPVGVTPLQASKAAMHDFTSTNV